MKLLRKAWPFPCNKLSYSKKECRYLMGGGIFFVRCRNYLRFCHQAVAILCYLCVCRMRVAFQRINKTSTFRMRGRCFHEANFCTTMNSARYKTVTYKGVKEGRSSVEDILSVFSIDGFVSDDEFAADMQLLVSGAMSPEQHRAYLKQKYQQN